MNREVKWFDIFIIFTLPLISTWLITSFHLSFLLNVLCFFGLPPLYLFFRNPQIVKKTVLFALIPWLPLTFIWEYLAYMDDIWFVPSPIRLLRGSIPYEDLFWGFLYLLHGISVWEFFFNSKRYTRSLFPPQMKYLIVGLYIVLGIFFILYILAPQYLYLPYFFIWMGVLFCLIPPFLFLFRHPDFLPRLLILIPYFFLSFGLMEYVALVEKHWYFPGLHYLGVINFFGYRLPSDEIIFLWILSVPSLVCWYEYFADDQK